MWNSRAWGGRPLQPLLVKMKRRIVKLCSSLLLLGAIINVAVAWACARCVSLHKWDRSAWIINLEDTKLWQMSVHWRPGARVIEAWPIVRGSQDETDDGQLTSRTELETELLRDLPTGWLNAVADASRPRQRPTTALIGDARGWPLPSLWRERAYDFSHELQTASESNHIDLTHMELLFVAHDLPDPKLIRQMALPVRPLWRNFVIDTAFYSSAIAMIWASARLVRSEVKKWSSRQRWRSATICGILGLFTTACVAWGCALFINPHSEDDRNQGEGGVTADPGYNFWSVERYERAGACVFVSWWYDPDVRIGIGGYFPEGDPHPLIPHWGWFLLPPIAPTTIGTEHVRIVDGRGWPFLALWSGIASENQSSAQPNLATIRTVRGIALATPSIHPRAKTANRVLPYAPVWTGLIANTLLYAVAWLVAFVAWLQAASFRGRWRIARALCPNCGYPTGTNPICTECGKPAKARS